MNKKSLSMFLLSAVAGVWTGCSQDEEVKSPASSFGGQEIAFRVQGGMPAERTRTTGATGGSMDAFVIYGGDGVLESPAPVEGKVPSFEEASYKPLFAGQVVSRQPGDGNVFDYAPHQYFHPGADFAKFFAYSPVSADVDLEFDTEEGNVACFEYTVPAPDKDGKTSPADLLVAYREHPGGNSFSDGVSLYFTHALSRIFVTGTNGLDQDITVTGLELINVSTTATYYYEIHIGSKDAAARWKPLESPVLDTYPYVLAEAGVSLRAGTSERKPLTSTEQGMLIIPQRVASDPDFALKVTYDVANLKGQVAYVSIDELNYEFEPGRQYAINISFEPTAAANLVEVKFGEIEVDDWDKPVLKVPQPDYIEIGGLKWALANVGQTWHPNPDGSDDGSLPDLANAVNQTVANMGYLYQWGRGYAPFAYSSPPSTQAGPVSLEEASGTYADKFITSSGEGTWLDPFDWSLWQEESQPAGSYNNPCPSGWRLPSSDNIHVLSSGSIYDRVQRINGWLKITEDGDTGYSLYLPAAGYIPKDDGTPASAGTYGRYWASIYAGVSQAMHLYFTNDVRAADGFPIANGCSVRCIQES